MIYQDFLLINLDIYVIMIEREDELVYVKWTFLVDVDDSLNRTLVTCQLS